MHYTIYNVQYIMICKIWKHSNMIDGILYAMCYVCCTMLTIVNLTSIVLGSDTEAVYVCILAVWVELIPKLLIRIGME